MINQCSYIIGTGTQPYRNLALEEYLLNSVQPQECILYLWQNQKTVVIGKNQNAWKECRVKDLEEDNGYLARRLSGGGAVFHDLGNLNFTFLMNTEDYSLSQQLDVILKAVQMLGLQAEKTGRNDITINGKKFSGNAFYHQGGKSYHHGTLMLHVDKELVAKYLYVSLAKLSSKGVSSVQSRVGNLADFCPTVTVEQMHTNLLEAFGTVYGATPQELPAERIEWTQVDTLQEKYASWDWRFGRKIAFEWAAEQRFEWGGIELEFQIEEGKVCDAAVYSDAMDAEFVQSLAPCFLGRIFSSDILSAAIDPLYERSFTPVQRQMVQDIQEMIRKQAF